MSGPIREVRLAPESIDALARRLADLLDRGPEDGDGEGTMLSAAEVARRWDVSRRWVYEHAVVLGARRLGDGPRPRLRFDPGEVARRLGAGISPPERQAARGGRRAHPGDARHAGRNRGKPDMFDGRRRKAAGGRCNAPGPVPKEVLRRAPKASPGGRPRPSSSAGEPGGECR